MNLRTKGLSTGLVIGALIALGTMLFGGTTAASGAGAGAAAKCNDAKNVQAIIDDSGSMASQDPQKFRLKFLDAFVGVRANAGLIFGGGEFGDSYNPLFGPATIPAVNAQMQAAFLQVNADNGGTDYQAAFAGATAQNPNADARIFLTDGGPTNEPPPTTSHLSPPTKTYVIGIGQFAATPDAQTVLGRIAAETGGPPPFLIQDSSQVQPVAGAVTAALNCKRIQTFVDTLDSQGDTASNRSKAKGKTMDVLATWPTTGTILNVKVLGLNPKKGARKGAVAVASKAKVKKTVGSNFVAVRVKGLRKGQKVRIKLRAKALAVPTTVTTQVIK